MQAESANIDMGVKCNLLPIHFVNRNSSKFLWLRSSVHQDTFVAKHEDGSFSILKVKDQGNVSSFVLDPDLLCVFWDNENASQNGQWLFAQANNQDVLLYAVDGDGVTEILRISRTNLARVIKTSPLLNTGMQDKSLELVGCDRGQIILAVCGLFLVCVEVETTGRMQLKCTVPFPHSASTYETKSGSKKSTFAVETFSCYQILNGTVVIIDRNTHILFMYSLSSGHCFSQLDLHPLAAEMNLTIEWRCSQDLNELMLLLNDWLIVHVNIDDYKSQYPSCVKHVDPRDHEQVFNQKYLSYNLCRYGDFTWKQEVVRQHLALSDSATQVKRAVPSVVVGQPVGFRINKKKAQKDGTSLLDSVPTSYKSTLQLEDIERKMNWRLETMEASKNILTLVLHRESASQSDRSKKAICFANFADHSIHLHHLSDSTSVVLSNSATCSHILLSDGYLMFISPHTRLQKDDLITWMMSYSGPGAADCLCQANQWTRTAIPLHALGSSLKQRQLDTLAFYFKSKRNLFIATMQSEQRSILVSEVKQFEDALNLVTATVTSCIADPQGRMFAERLLSLTLDFVYGLLDDARQVSQQGEGRAQVTGEEVEEWCHVLLSHIPALRKCMYTLQYRVPPNRPGVLVLNEQKILETNKDLSTELSLENSVKDNSISSFQANLMSGTKKEMLHYRELVAQMLNVARQHMEKKDISSCQHILKNLGCDVPSTMWSLAQFYASRSLQQFISGQLSAAAALAPSQRQIVQYLENLYKAYPCASFSTAMKSKVEDKTGTWPDKEDPLQEAVFASDTFLLSHCGELTQESSSELSGQHGDLYAALLLAWLANWSEDMKQTVMLDAHFLSSGDALLALQSEPRCAWQYLISHSLLDTLLSLLKSVASDARLALPAEVTNYLSFGWSHLRNELARELIKLEKLNIESAISQGIDIPALLPSIGDIMKKPHPLSYIGPSLMSKFHTEFMTHCINAGLQLPLWMYSSIHGINPSEVKLAQECSWFPLFQAAYSIPRHPTDRALMLSASLLAADDFWASSSGKMTIEMMLEKNQILAAVGTLSYMSEEQLKLNVSVVERCLHKFPKLILALLPEGHEASSKQNTTVYQLLMGTAPFDLRRLFGWHSTNTFAREDSPKVMPHFSEPHLKSSHSRHQKLLFPYYLKHGRPVYAFLSFLSEELDRGEATLSLKRIQQACGAALWIACEHFKTSQITSSCVVFVELLGRDSALVRSMIHSGRLLFAHRHRNIGGGTEAKKEQLKECVAEIELQACVRSRHRHGNKLIKSLETAIKEEIRLEGIGSCSFEASHKWMLVVMLCKLLGLPLSTCFLQLCAESDNWLMFVWFAQLHQYPTHQLQMLLHSFASAHLRDHLHYVLNNADCKLFSSSSSSSSSALSSISNANERSSQRQRASLHNRIGLQRSKADSSSDEEEGKSGHSIISSFSSRLRQSEFNESEMPESTAPEDVFRMLFHTSSMPSQWKCLLAASVSLRNPLFADLAACCGCPAIPSLCGWLLASLSAQVQQNLLSTNGHQVSKWTVEHLEAVIDATLVCGQEDTLSTAFTILQPHSPLLPFLNFVTECVKRGNYAACKTYIDQFKDAMASSDNQKSPTKIASDVQTIGDRAWFEKIAYEIIKHELRAASSLYHAKHLLEILDKHNICLVFSFDVLDFAQLHKVINILHANSVPNLQLPSLLTSGPGSSPFVTQCEAAVDCLIKCGQFSEAKELTKVAGISREKVTISQLKEEKQKLVNCGVWTAKFVRAQYWNKCKELIQQADCTLESSVNFFQDELQGASAEFEKALLCQHLFALLEGNTISEVATIKDAVFREMWRHRIAAKVALEELEPLDQVFDEVNLSTVRQGDHKSDLVNVTVVSHNGSDAHDLNVQELEVLDTLIGNYLDKGRVSACTEVAAVFGHYNQDLAIIKTCITLATRQNSIDHIEPAMKRLVAKNSSQRRRVSSITMNQSFSFNSISSLTSGQMDVSTMTEAQELIAVMEKLYVHCNKGSQVCLRVITCFKIADLLGQAYRDVVMNSPFDSLRQLLRLNDPNKFSLARDFLATSGLSDDEVTGFLADSIVDVLKIFVKGNNSDVDSEIRGGHSELMFNPSDGMEVFSQFLKLCENFALLGERILQAATALLSIGQQDMSATVLTIQTELIIMAHECFTISSNMEGISHVLRAVRVCCDCIAEAGEYALMIRLLTGVGRYSEMMYIFHSLQQNHQFELLLRKGMDREDKLKVAILDYLKRYQPDDNEAYTMVALKFTMYRDIAGMLEACGYRSLKLLKDKPLDNSKDVQDLLKKCLQYFRDAAESYVKDNSVRKAQHCVRQARLLSLQLQLLVNGISVINLNRDQATAFVNTHGRFIEAMVVADAYDKRADWSEAVFNNVVTNGDMRYLQELRLHVHITSTLVEDVIKRYKQATIKPSTALAAIKKLLTLTKDVQLQYRLASELGLTDMITAMLKGDTGSYLQDITTVL